MQVIETHNEGLQHEFKVVVPAHDIDEKLNIKLSDLSKTVNLPGFRPGKVPAPLIKQRFGQSVMGEVLQETVDTSSQQAIIERGLKLALQPKIEITKFEEGSDLEYTMAVEIIPDIELTDFSKLKLERMKSEVRDEDVEAALQQVARDHRTFTPSPDKVSETGDVVVINFVGKVDGEPFEGGSAEDHRLELGSGQFLPGFEDQLVGSKVGDKIEVKLQFPAEYGSSDQAKTLAGKMVIFDVDVKNIEQAKIHLIDDELAKHVGLETLEQLRNALRDQLAKELDGVSRDKLKRVLLDELSDKHDFQIPPTLLEQEFNMIWKQYSDAKGKGLSDEEDNTKSEDELKEEYRGIAERRVRLGLVLANVGEANEITVHQEEMNRALSDRARRTPGQERQLIEFYQNNPQAMAQLRAPIFEDKVIDFIMEQASVTERIISREELFEQDVLPIKKGPDKDKKKVKSRAKPKTKTSGKTRGTKTGRKPTVKKGTDKNKARKDSGKSTARVGGSAAKSPVKKSTSKRIVKT